MPNVLTIPGMVDPHVHLRGMAWSHKGDFTTETRAAVAGGYWAVFDMPNTPPATVDRESLDAKLNAIDSQAVCDWGVYFCAAASGNWDQYPAIIGDVCGVKMFNNSTTGNLLVEDTRIREGHYRHWSADKVFANHAEDETCAAIIELVRRYRRPTHIVHVCTAYEVDLIRAAKAEGLPITCGVCPHHLWLTERDVEHLGSLGRMKPGLKTQADQDALWQALAEGVIDVVESDHAPHTLEEKATDPAPYGVPGLETTLPLLLTAVKEGRLTTGQVVALVAENPRRILGLTCPPDTYTIIDLDTTRVIDRRSLHTHVGWSPFEGMRVYGKVTENWIRGTQVYDGESVLVEPGFGKNCYA
ncbi:MAG: dihydroorotase [Chloroflexota bacterium]